MVAITGWLPHTVTVYWGSTAAGYWHIYNTERILLIISLWRAFWSAGSWWYCNMSWSRAPLDRGWEASTSMCTTWPRTLDNKESLLYVITVTSAESCNKHDSKTDTLVCLSVLYSTIHQCYNVIHISAATHMPQACTRTHSVLPSGSLHKLPYTRYIYSIRTHAHLLRSVFNVNRHSTVITCGLQWKHYVWIQPQQLIVCADSVALGGEECGLTTSHRLTLSSEVVFQGHSLTWASSWNWCPLMSPRAEWGPALSVWTRREPLATCRTPSESGRCLSYL